MKIDDCYEGEILIVSPSGKLDTNNAPGFSQHMKECFEDKPKACLLDLTQISFLSSAGLQAILAAAKIAKQAQMHFGIFGMQEMAYNVFTMGGFNQFIQCFDAKEEALSNLL